MLENSFNSFSFSRLLNGLVFIEVVYPQTAISAFRAMLITTSISHTFLKIKYSAARLSNY